MAHDNKKELDKIDLFFDSTMKRFKSTFKAAVKEIGYRLVDKTPVYFLHETDKAGNTRANWNISVGNPDLNVNETATDPSGEATKSKIRAYVQSTPVTDTTVFYLANNTEAIYALEYGLYPTQHLTNPEVQRGVVKKGSWNSQTKGYVIRSTGGFSKRAVKGVVRITTMNWPLIVLEEAKKRNPVGE
jgi:hypothetical protein